MSKIRVTIWNEFRHEKQSEKVKKLETTRYERIDKYMEENLDIIKNFQ